MKTESHAVLEAAKSKRTELATAVHEALIHASADAADLEVCCAHILTYDDPHAYAIAAAKPDDVIAIEDAQRRANVSVAIAAAKAKASAARHASAAIELRQGEKAITEAATAVFNDELIARAVRFVQKLDAVLGEGEELRTLSGSDLLHQALNVAPVALPAEVTRALACLPLRDQLHVRVDQLRNGDAISDARSRRLAELAA